MRGHLISIRLVPVLSISLITGAQYVKTGSYEHVLVIGADACSRMLNWEDRATCVLFGDGASAVLLSRNENPEIGVQSHFTRTDGGGMRSLWIYAGGSDRPIDEEVLKESFIMYKCLVVMSLSLRSKRSANQQQSNGTRRSRRFRYSFDGSSSGESAYYSSCCKEVKYT